MTEAALKLVESPEVQALEKKSFSIVDQAKGLAISSPSEFELAGEILLSIKDTRKELNKEFDDGIKAAHDAHKKIVAMKKKYEVPLSEAESIIKGKISAFTMEQERIRREEEARLAAEQRKKEEEAKLSQAIAAEEAGEKEQAEQILSEPTYAAPVVVPTSTPKVAGISTRMVWDFQVIDPSMVPDQFKVIDEKKIAGVVRSLGANARIPGVRVYQKPVVAAGRR